ncbi:MAG: hypothetical protein ACTHMS_01340 [Jatrophihabitans sp.]|uniref:hypothetical protein n=1 Tax=Jatrophihabitans sp. TaxID=1932789 RepID=UPI003F807A40
MKDEAAVIEGRRWAVTPAALSGLIDDRRWKEWDGRPAAAEPREAAELDFAGVLDQVFDTERAMLAALEGFADVPTPVRRALVDASYQVLASMPTPGDPAVPLYRAVSGGKLHLPDCPHVRAIDLVEASGSDRASFAVCASWCQRELAGEGRTYHNTLAAALDDLGAPHHTRPELERLLNQVEYDTIFVPNSRTYVAVTRAGKATAWAGMTYVGFTGAEPRIVYLPDYIAGGGGGKEKDERRGEICPVHGYEMSVTGVCWGCE